jgi:phosphatidylinositol-3-phosphatase
MNGRLSGQAPMLRHLHRPLRSAAALLLIAGIAAVEVSATTAAATKPQRSAAASNYTCGALVGRPAHITHVVWIVMENRSYSEVIGGGAPYISTLAARCGVATNYHNVTHPSLPNYIAMTSGRQLGALPTTDCPIFCPVSGPSIFTQTTSWRVYAESMPGNCVRQDARPYVAHHNPAVYYTGVTNCATNDVPLTALNLGALPAFSLIIPNVFDDMHPLSSTVAAGDAWLRVHLGAVLTSRAYLSGSTAVFLTWDEGGTPRSTNDCATNTTDPGCQVALLGISPYTPPGSRWASLSNHYVLLRATQRLLRLPALP